MHATYPIHTCIKSACVHVWDDRIYNNKLSANTYIDYNISNKTNIFNSFSSNNNQHSRHGDDVWGYHGLCGRGENNNNKWC